MQASIKTARRATLCLPPGSPKQTDAGIGNQGDASHQQQREKNDNRNPCVTHCLLPMAARMRERVSAPETFRPFRVNSLGFKWEWTFPCSLQRASTYIRRPKKSEIGQKPISNPKS
jgi:hypothetical protein